YVAWKYEDMEKARGRAGEPALPPKATAAEESALRKSVICGPPEQVADAIDQFRRAAGGDLVFVAGLYLPGLAWDVQVRAVQVFARQVAPLLREQAAGGDRD